MDSPDISGQIARAANFSDLLSVVPAINRELGTPAAPAAYSWASAGLPDKLQEWLEKLQDKLAEIAKGHDAVSYSLTVGFPVGVSVTVTFGPET